MVIFLVRASLVSGLFLVFPVALVTGQEVSDDISGDDGSYGGVGYVVTFPANTEFGVLGGCIGGGRATDRGRWELSFGFHMAPVKQISGPDASDVEESTVVMTRLDVMGGVIHDFGAGAGFVPFIGVGGGITLVGHTGTLILVPVPALQGALGVSYAVTEAMYVTLGYRMHGLLFPPLLYHQVEAGVRFRF